MKFITAVDDFRSYEIIEQFQPFFLQFKEHMMFEIHLKIFKKSSTNFLTFDANDCIGQEPEQYCTTKSFEDNANVNGLGAETLKHICLKNMDLQQYFKYIGAVRQNCFEGESLKANFNECTSNQFQTVVDAKLRSRLQNCMKEETSESKEALNSNNDNIKYFLINYSPLVFINGFHHKGNYDDLNHLMESFCNSFEMPPKQCSDLQSFKQSDELNSIHLAHFIMISCMICLVCGVLAILIFYLLMKRKIRKRFNFELRDKINEALANYYGDENVTAQEEVPEVEARKN